MKNTLYFHNAAKHNEEQSAQNVKTPVHLEEYDLVKYFPMKIFANDFFVVLRKCKNI